MHNDNSSRIVQLWDIVIALKKALSHDGSLLPLDSCNIWRQVQVIFSISTKHLNWSYYVLRMWLREAEPADIQCKKIHIYWHFSLVSQQMVSVKNEYLNPCLPLICWICWNSYLLEYCWNKWYNQIVQSSLPEYCIVFFCCFK